MTGCATQGHRPTDVRRRVVILGASNVSRSIGTIIRTSLAICREPAEFLIAAGHGRSYGHWSSVLFRQLPGIRDCGLWQAWGSRPDLPTLALLTDIGNDLLYEQPPDRIAEWVEACLARLAARGARTIVTELPLTNFEGLSEARFRFFRALFVPGCRLSRTELALRAARLNEHVVALAAKFGADIRTPRRQWYGLDPIHIRYGIRSAAWREFLAGWLDTGILGDVAPRSVRTALYLRTRLPAERRLGRLVQRREQPSAFLSDGSTIAFY